MEHCRFGLLRFLYAYYFEGLFCQKQGENDKAKVACENTLLNPAYPEDGVDFYYLRKMEIDVLYSLRDEGERAATYLDAGLVIAPEDEGLQKRYNALSQAGGDTP